MVEDNHVAYGRDVVVWYSPGNRLRRNLVEQARYGTHFMFSSGCSVEESRYLGDVVGIFVMYSRDLDIRGNVLAGASGAAGMGLGLKESGNLVIEGNRLLHDTIGLYVDTSPLNPGDRIRFAGNEVSNAEVGIQFLAPRPGSAFTGNQLRDNAVPYQLRSLSGELTARTPELRLLRGTPALTLIDAVSHLVPLWSPQLVLIDRRPRFGAGPGASHAN